jgi:MYXO-CTERM domain-containing protein
MPVAADLMAQVSLIPADVDRSVGSAVAESQSQAGQRVDVRFLLDRLSSDQLSADQPPADHPPVDRSGGAQSAAPLDGLLIGLLLLALALGLLLGWRRRRQRGGQSLDGVLPPSWVRPGTPHERLHDPVYLQRMLEAEQVQKRRSLRDGRRRQVEEDEVRPDS